MRTAPLTATLATTALMLTATPITARDLSSAAIEQRQGPILTEQEVRRARIEGECLAGIYQNNAFQGEYNPINEWLRVRTSHLLQKHSPCELLVMLEVAREQMESARAEDRARSEEE